MTTWSSAAVAAASVAAGVVWETLTVARAALARRAEVEAAIAAGATAAEAVRSVEPRKVVGRLFPIFGVLQRLIEIYALGLPQHGPWDALFFVSCAYWGPAMRRLARALVLRRLFSDGLPPEEPEAGAAHAFRIVGPIKTYDKNVRPKTFADRDLKD